MNIYIIISKTPTVMGRVIRQVLDNKYNHMSICTKGDLSRIYSFGRVSAKNFLTGGPMEESYYTLSLGGMSDVDICVFRLAVTKNQHDKLMQFINNVFYDVDGYVYNLADAIGTIFHHQIRVDKCYTCIAFCKDALKYAGVETYKLLEKENTLDGVRAKLKHFIVYEGTYKLYPNVYLDVTERDERFMRSRGFYTELKYTITSFRKLVGRVYRTKHRMENSEK